MGLFSLTQELAIDLGTANTLIANIFFIFSCRLQV